MGNELENYNVTMSNALTRASHGLTLLEKRIIASCIAKVDSRIGSRTHAHLSDFEKIKITADEYAETFSIDMRHAYEHLKNSADMLFSRYFTINLENGHGKYRWLSGVEYMDGDGYIEISFSQFAYPHLRALRTQYTTYKLKDAADLKTAYAWRLYEVAKSWLEHCRSGKRVKINLKNLYNQMGAPDSYTWKDFRVNALDKAINEIMLKTDMVISYEVIKKGRAVNALEFVFSKPE